MKQIHLLVAIILTGVLACAWGISNSSADGSGLFEQAPGGLDAKYHTRKAFRDYSSRHTAGGGEAGGLDPQRFTNFSTTNLWRMATKANTSGATFTGRVYVIPSHLDSLDPAFTVGDISPYGAPSAVMFSSINNETLFCDSTNNYAGHFQSGVRGKGLYVNSMTCGDFARFNNISATAYYGDGSHLTGIAGGGGSGLNPARFVNYSSRNLPTDVNVKAYGAKGDGVTDDRAAIQEAVDAAGGKRVVLPGSIAFSISSPINLANGSTFIVDGTLKASSNFSGTAMIIAEAAGGDTNTMKKVYIGGHGVIDGSQVANEGIYFKSGKQSSIEGLRVVNVNRIPVHIGDPGGIGGYEVNCRNLSIENYRGVSSRNNDSSSVGVYYENVADSVIDNVVVIGYRTGIRYDRGGMELTNTHVWTNWQGLYGPLKYAYYCAGPDSHLVNCYADTPTNAGDPAITDAYAFYIAADDVFMTNPRVYGYSIPDNVVTAFYLAAGGHGTITGGKVWSQNAGQNYKSVFSAAPGVYNNLNVTGLRDDGRWYAYGIGGSNRFADDVHVKEGRNLFMDGTNTHATSRYGDSGAGYDGLLDIDIFPGTGTNAATYRFFRNVTTSGPVKVQVLKGNKTSTVVHELDGKGNADFCKTGGSLTMRGQVVALQSDVSSEAATRAAADAAANARLYPYGNTTSMYRDFAPSPFTAVNYKTFGNISGAHIRGVVIGDSTANGLGVPWTSAWPHKAAAKWAAQHPGWTVIYHAGHQANLNFSGYSTVETIQTGTQGKIFEVWNGAVTGSQKSDWINNVGGAWTNLVAPVGTPDFAVVWLGHNDDTEDIPAQVTKLGQLVAKFRTGMNPEILLASQNPKGDRTGYNVPRATAMAAAINNCGHWFVRGELKRQLPVSWGMGPAHVVHLSEAGNEAIANSLMQFFSEDSKPLFDAPYVNIPKFTQYSGGVVNALAGKVGITTFNTYTSYPRFQTTGNTDITLYVDWRTGSNSNSGKSASSPKQTLDGCLDAYAVNKMRTCNISIFMNRTGVYSEVTKAVNLQSAGNYTITIYGDQSTAHRTGSATSNGGVNGFNRGTTLIDSGASDFTPYLGLGCFIELTSGAWSGSKFRISGWDNGTHAYTVYDFFPGQITAGTTYKIDVYSPNRGQYRIVPTTAARAVYVYNTRNFNVTGIKTDNQLAKNTGMFYDANSSGTVNYCDIVNCLATGLNVQNGSIIFANNCQTNDCSSGTGVGVYMNANANATLTNHVSKGNSSGFDISCSQLVINHGSVSDNTVMGARVLQSFLHVGDCAWRGNADAQVELTGSSHFWLRNLSRMYGDGISNRLGIRLIGSTLTANETSAAIISNFSGGGGAGIYARPGSFGDTSGVMYSNNTTDKWISTETMLP